MATPDISHRAVYAIRCNDGRHYVGASKEVLRRWTWHRSLLGAGKHANAKLQAAWSQYGSAAFTFEVLETVERAEDLSAREQFWMDRLAAATEGFNISPTSGGSNRGIIRSAEIRARVTASHIGTQVGEKNPSAKLTDDLVREIRRRLEAGDSHRPLATRYGVSRAVIGRIARREKWSHVA